MLLVGNKEEDFFLIREILERTRTLLTADLDHAHSLEEARAMLAQKNYGLVLLEHETGAEGVQFLTHFQQAGVPVPFIVLTENADEATVAEIIDGGGAWNCVAKSQLDGATLVRTIRNTLAMYSLQQEHKIAEESLRKLSRAVEQSADMVMVTDRKSVV